MDSESEERCPVCNEELLKTPSAIGDNREFDCLACGNFRASASALATLPEYWRHYPDRRPILSHFIRRMPVDNQLPTLRDDMCKRIIETQTLPSPFEQADNLIRWIGDNCNGPGEAAGENILALQSIIGASSPAGLRFVDEGLRDQGMINHNTLKGFQSAYSLTFSGWKRHEELTRGAHFGRTAFMAMQYGDPQTDHVFEECFYSAVEETGFRLMRVVDDPRAGIIDDRIRVDIQSSRFVVVDLTQDNSGAYWEAGYAEGMGKPVIYTCEKKKTHFDTNHLTTVLWSIDDYDDAAKRLKATIRATIPEARREEN